MAALGSPRRKLLLVAAKRFAMTKDMACHGEEQEDLKDQPRARHDKDVRNGEATIHWGEEKSK